MEQRQCQPRRRREEKMRFCAQIHAISQSKERTYGGYGRALCTLWLMLRPYMEV